jgi:hypothetical protein
MYLERNGEAGSGQRGLFVQFGGKGARAGVVQPERALVVLVQQSGDGAGQVVQNDLRHTTQRPQVPREVSLPAWGGGEVWKTNLGRTELGKVDGAGRRVQVATLEQVAQHEHKLLQDLHLSRRTYRSI